MTEKQRDLIKAMNEFCREKFDLSYPRTKEEARCYISRNFEEYKLESTILNGSWHLENGEF